VGWRRPKRACRGHKTGALHLPDYTGGIEIGGNRAESSPVCAADRLFQHDPGHDSGPKADNPRAIQKSDASKIRQSAGHKAAERRVAVCEPASFRTEADPLALIKARRMADRRACDERRAAAPWRGVRVGGRRVVLDPKLSQGHTRRFQTDDPRSNSSARSCSRKICATASGGGWVFRPRPGRGSIAEIILRASLWALAASAVGSTRLPEMPQTTSSSTGPRQATPRLRLRGGEVIGGDGLILSIAAGVHHRLRLGDA